METGESQNLQPPIESESLENVQHDFAAARRALSEDDSIVTVSPRIKIQEYLGNDSFKDFTENEQFIKRTKDLRKLVEIHQKVEDGSALDREDLRFLYQTDAKIDDFGFDGDLGVGGVLSGRDIEKDELTIFGCEPSQIAREPSQINENTKVYIGQLSGEILNLLKKHDVKDIFSGFPSERIRLENLEIGGRSTNQLREDFASQNIPLTGYASELLDKVDKVLNSSTLTEDDKDLLKDQGFSVYKREVNLVTLSIGDLGLTSDSTIDQVYERAKSMGLEMSSADVGIYLRLKYKDQPVNEKIYVGMEPVRDDPGDLHVFSVANHEGDNWLDDAWTLDTNQFDINSKFVFTVSS